MILLFILKLATLSAVTEIPVMAAKTLMLSLLIFVFNIARSDMVFRFENQCPYTIWLAASPSIGDADPERSPGTLEIFSMPDSWTGSIWARTRCSQNASSFFFCETGDCGSGLPDCQSPPPRYPVTLLNFAIAQSAVSYEVSLNHGVNIPVRVEPDGGSLVEGSGPCPVVDCARDIGDVCPAPLVAKNSNGAYTGCYSACDALKDDLSCCTGNYSGSKCGPNQYSQMFKQLCSKARTYPADNDPPFYKCTAAASYNVTFCPV